MPRDRRTRGRRRSRSSTRCASRFDASSARPAHRVPRPQRGAPWPSCAGRCATAGGEYKIYKNTLVRFAARDLGLDIDDAAAPARPPSPSSTGDAGRTVAKALRDFARTNPALVVKGGLLGEKRARRRRRQALADVAPREVLLAQLAGAMAAPMQQFAGLLQALPRNFAYGLQGPDRPEGRRARRTDGRARAEAAAEPDAAAPSRRRRRRRRPKRPPPTKPPRRSPGRGRRDPEAETGRDRTPEES